MPHSSFARASSPFQHSRKSVVHRLMQMPQAAVAQVRYWPPSSSNPKEAMPMPAA